MATSGRSFRHRHTIARPLAVAIDRAAPCRPSPCVLSRLSFSSECIPFCKRRTASPPRTERGRLQSMPRRLGFRVRSASITCQQALSILALLLCLWNSPLRAGAPWFARVWQVDDGLPGDNVTGVTQTKDGYLWIATQTGLARFDGLHIKSVNIRGDRPHPIIRAMCRDRADQLWLALEGGTITHWPPTNSPRVFGATNGLPRMQPAEILEGGDGAMWVSYLDGPVCRISGKTVTSFAESDGPDGWGHL